MPFGSEERCHFIRIFLFLMEKKWWIEREREREISRERENRIDRRRESEKIREIKGGDAGVNNLNMNGFSRFNFKQNQNL